MVADPFIPEDLYGGEDEFFLMVNVSPKSSGLPFVVWFGPKADARHDARVKVGQAAKALPLRASVSVRPTVNIVAGDLSAADLAKLRQWIDLNRDVILGHWDGTIEYSEDVLAALRPIEH
jgi:hypothetical protein